MLIGVLFLIVDVFFAYNFKQDKYRKLYKLLYEKYLSLNNSAFCTAKSRFLSQYYLIFTEISLLAVIINKTT